MTQLNKQDIEMLGKIADIIKDSDFEIKNVTCTCENKVAYESPYAVKHGRDLALLKNDKEEK